MWSWVVEGKSWKCKLEPFWRGSGAKAIEELFRAVPYRGLSWQGFEERAEKGY